MINWVYRIRW